ncbi:hypothetical protein [Persicitalea sp.]|uniref:tetratricopeptide repeat protein n=1 Tax=Persicitalea sp. TaxID=3100273 RepID=UPI0035949252
MTINIKNLGFAVALVVGLILLFPSLLFAQKAATKKSTNSKTAKKSTTSEKKPDAAPQTQEEAQKYFNSGVSTLDRVKLNLRRDVSLENRSSIATTIIKDLIDAINDFNKTIELRLDFAEAYYRRGTARQILSAAVPSNSQKAAIQIILKDFDKAIELKPGYADAYLARAWHLTTDDAFAEGLADLVKAVQDCEKGINLNPKLGEGYFVRGNIKHRQNKLSEAMADYDKAVQSISSVIAPDVLYYKRGVIKDSWKDYRGAMQEYTRAIGFMPSSERSYLNRGTAKFYLSDNSACDDWSRACSLGNGIGCNNVAQFCRR